MILNMWWYWWWWWYCYSWWFWLWWCWSMLISKYLLMVYYQYMVPTSSRYLSSSHCSVAPFEASGPVTDCRGRHARFHQIGGSSYPCLEECVYINIYVYMNMMFILKYYMVYYILLYYMIWFDLFILIWYDFIRYDMICLGMTWYVFTIYFTLYIFFTIWYCTLLHICLLLYMIF
jgi:hypothetical protein